MHVRRRDFHLQLPMIIGLDYDDTWTRDPDGWFTAMMALKMRGHTIYGITMRYPREASGMDSRYDQVCEQILFTGRRQKKFRRRAWNSRGCVD